MVWNYANIAHRLGKYGGKNHNTLCDNPAIRRRIIAFSMPLGCDDNETYSSGFRYDAIPK